MSTYEYDNYRERLTAWYKFAYPHNLTQLETLDEIVKLAISIQATMEEIQSYTFEGL